MDHGPDGRHGWTLIVILDGFGCTQAFAIVVFHLVPRNSHHPGLQGASTSKLAEAFPCREEDFLDQVLDLIVARGKTGTNVAVDTIPEVTLRTMWSRAKLKVLQPKFRRRIGFDVGRT